MTAYKTNRERNSSNSLAVRAVSLIAVFCILASLAILLHGRIFSVEIGGTAAQKQVPDVENTAYKGQKVINTTEAGKAFKGYNDLVPLEIYMTDGRIDSVKALPNKETPSFFERASVLLHSWDGLSVQQAATKKVDAVSGATYSSKAIIDNFHAGLKEAELDADVTASEDSDFWTIKYTLALLVAMAATVFPLFIKNKTYRLVQQFLNVAVLGFWTGTFLDYTVLIRTFADGLPYSLASIVTLLLLVVAFIFPLFGHHGHYCAWVCPMGSLQELAGKVPLPKLHLSHGALRALTFFRNALWCLLVLGLWSGLFASWIDYEIFSAFIVKSASLTVIIIGALFIVLSMFTARPFCRFVCPVGTILNHSENRN